MYICLEFECQSAGFPGAVLPDHLVCVDTLVHVRMENYEREPRELLCWHSRAQVRLHPSHTTK